MNDKHDTDGNGRKPYPSTARWEPLLSPEEIRVARCDDCGGQAKYVLLTLSRGYSWPREGDVAAVVGCDCTEYECTDENHPARSNRTCPDMGHRTGYGPIELAELADRVEGADWAQHLAGKSWWQDGGAAALRARFAPDAPHLTGGYEGERRRRVRLPEEERHETETRWREPRSFKELAEMRERGELR